MRNFNKGSVDEFRCRCGCRLGFKEMKPEMLSRLDNARDIAGVSFVLNRGISCGLHNMNIGGSETSSHLYGYAVDIRSNDGSVNRFKRVKALLDAGFTRIGIYNTFIHADYDINKPQEVMWLGK